MKLADIRCGEQYAFAQGRQTVEHLYGAYRCVVLSLVPHHGIYRDWLGLGQTFEKSVQDIDLHQYMCVPGTRRRTRGRIAVAIEIPILRTLGDPTDRYGYGSETEVVSGFWIPFAALPSQLYCLWSEEAERREKERLRRIEVDRIMEEQALIRAEEQARKAEQDRAMLAQREKEERLRQEFYDTRLAPLLAEAGVDLDKDVVLDSRGTRVQIDGEVLAKILSTNKE